MKKHILLASLLVASVAGAADRQPNAIIEKNTRRAHGDNHISLELGGRGMFYSVNYDRSLLGQYLAVGAGFSYMGLETKNHGKVPMTVFPIYSNIYAGVKAHRPFLTGGASVTTLHGDLPNDAEGLLGVFPNLGAGYEYRSDEGFIFRASPYVAWVPKATGWFGVSFGGSF